MSNEEAPTKYLVAAKGFAANGKAMEEGEYLTDQFDEQTVKVLARMGRLVETTTPPGEPELDLKPLTKAEKKAQEDAAAAAAAAAAVKLPGA